VREIKFRAWANYIKEMVYGIEDSIDGCLSDWGDSLMQYTGMKDKLGKEIYVGDIVSVPDSAYGEVVDIKPDNSNQWLYSVKGDGWVHGIDDVTVIGNIYENPSLAETA